MSSVGFVFWDATPSKHRALLVNFSSARGAVGIKISYLICRVQCRVKMQGPFFKNY